MGDEELRSLERAVAGGGAQARLAYARALVRAGRHDEGLAALASDLSDPLVRREAGLFPAWDTPRGGPGGTHWLDVPPLVSAPAARRICEPTRTSGYHRELAASVLGVAVFEHDGRRSRTKVFDARTGDHRFDLKWSAATVMTTIGRGTLHAGSLVLHDLWDERLVVRGFVKGEPVVSASGLLLARHKDQLVAYDWPEVAVVPATPRWSRTVPGDIEVSGVTATSVLAWSGREIALLDRASGAERWRASDVHHGAWAMIDERGVAAPLGPAGSQRARCWDLDGRVAWTLDAKAIPLAMSPDVVLVGRDHEELVAVDRSSGKERAVLGTAESWTAIAAARDVVYFASKTSAVHASTIDGRLLFTVPLETVGLDVWRLCVLPRQLLLLDTYGSLVALEE